MLALEKSWAQEHRKKAEVTEECVDERGNATKLGLIFFTGRRILRIAHRGICDKKQDSKSPSIATDAKELTGFN